jgi:hypothetical protein
LSCASSFSKSSCGIKGFFVYVSIINQKGHLWDALVTVIQVSLCEELCIVKIYLSMVNSVT